MKSSRNVFTKLCVAASGLAASGVAMAHPDHGLSGFVDGLAHPWSGWDHLLAMAAIGLWAAQSAATAAPGTQQRVLWALPAAFVLSAAFAGAAACLGEFQLAASGIETGIAVSLLVLGGLLLAQRRLPLMVMIGIAALAGSVHGYAHGIEMPETATGLLYGAGFILSTALLHGLGVAGGLLATRSHSGWLLRLAGLGVVAGGTLAVAL